MKDLITNKIALNRNFAIISKNFEEVLETIAEITKNHRLIIIENDTFLTDDSKKAIKEAYICENEIKYIVLIAQAFNIYAQNSLLKILEETPSNIIFIIVTYAKATLLPTVQSRVLMLEIKDKEPKFVLSFNLFKLDLKIIFELLQEYKYKSGDEVKKLIETILIDLLKNKKNLEQNDFDIFSRAIELLSVNANNQFILSSVLLRVLKII